MPALTLNTLKPAHGSRVRKFRVGRGNATGRGTTAGRGTKGQKARTGGSNRLMLKGMKQMLLRIPKNRGFTSTIPHAYAITLEQLERWCKAGDRVTLEAFQKRNLVPQHLIGLKVLNTGTLSKPLTLVDVAATAGAKAAIEKAGGTFETTLEKKPSSAQASKGKPVAKKALKK